MTQPTPLIRPVGDVDAVAVAHLIGDAFSELAVAAWLVPDPGERATVLGKNFEIIVQHALAHGEVQVIDDSDDGSLVAAAVWIHHESDEPVPPPVDYERRLDAACGKHADRFRTLDELMEKNHPAVHPHHHLALLATRPGLRDRGFGGVLLDHHRAVLDANRMPAYLEAASEDSRRLYERHGYSAFGEPFRIPDGTPMWPMWRAEPT